jgi:hypothetical protein
MTSKRADMSKKTEKALVRSSAAECLTFVTAGMAEGWVVKGIRCEGVER